MSPAEVRVVRRVTAVLNGGSHGTDVLAVAAEVAAHLHAEVQGLMLEDPNLHRMAELGIVRMVSLFEAAGPSLPLDLAATLQRLAAEAETTLGAAARALGVAWSFQVLQGDAVADLPRAIGRDELLVVKLSHGWASSNGRFATAVCQASAGIAASVLLVERRLRRTAPAVLVAAESDLAERALAIGLRLGDERAPLDVLLSAPPERAAQVGAWIGERVAAFGRRCRVTPLAAADENAVAAAAQRGGVGILVIPADAPCLMELDRIPILAGNAGCALLLLR